MSSRRTAAKPRKSAPGTRYPGASTNPLTTRQKGVVVMLARRAFNHRRVGGDFNAWRRDEQEKAVGQTSLTVCCQADYNMLVAHFEGLAGEGTKEFQAAYRDLDERTRQARHLLEDALNDRDLDLSYAEAICRTQYKRGLDEATADQLWRIKFTVENRRDAVAKQTADSPF